MSNVLHPILKRLKLWMSWRIPNLEATMTQILGMGEKREQLTKKTTNLVGVKLGLCKCQWQGHGVKNDGC